MLRDSRVQQDLTGAFRMRCREACRARHVPGERRIRDRAVFAVDVALSLRERNGQSAIPFGLVIKECTQLEQPGALTSRDECLVKAAVCNRIRFVEQAEISRSSLRRMGEQAIRCHEPRLPPYIAMCPRILQTQELHFEPARRE